jgi:hypothetical protein
MNIRLFCLVTVLILAGASPLHARDLKPVPESVYAGLEYLLTIPGGTDDIVPERLNHIIDFVVSTPADASMSMQDRDKASGAFHSFTLKGDLSRVLDYAYNPDIPVYVTMPSSVREQEWLASGTREGLKALPQAVKDGSRFLVRGAEREIITPDANTGGYYAYTQDRAVAVFPGATGPVLVSVGCQTEPSEVGRKGCVVGDDSGWNYLYSGETGLNKTGLGWVDSYMYNAHSVIVFVTDTEAGVVRVGSFKWLNAGWASMNMVKQMHIVNGIKRFAADFKAVLESPRLPDVRELTSLYSGLLSDSVDSLRAMVEPYLAAIVSSGKASDLSRSFRKLLDSGEYLRNMTREEMVKIVLKEFLKERIGRPNLIRVAQAGNSWTAFP